MYALMYPILYIASIHCYIPLLTATSMSVCSVCIVLWHDHVNGEIKALKKKKKKVWFTYITAKDESHFQKVRQMM